MRLTDKHPEQLLAWAARKLGTNGWSDDAMPFGVVEDRPGLRPLVRAVIVINCRFGASCRMHIATDGSRRWATRDVLIRLSAFIHLGLGARRVETIIAARNLPAQIAALKVGFQVEGRTRCSADDGTDGIVLAILAEENPWLKGDDDGQGRTGT